MASSETLVRDDDVEFVPQWGNAAPKGGRAVLNRMLRDGTKVPLFLGQTFVNSLRDVGYNDTTSAVCEHVDNAIQAGASEIRVYSNFIVYRSRAETEQDFYVGTRHDVLRRVAGSWRIAGRKIVLDQNVLTAKNVSIFF